MAFTAERIRLTEGQRERLVMYMEEEFSRADDYRTPYFNDVNTWVRAYHAKPIERYKTFPWEGAANFVAPLVAIAVDSVSARMLNTIFGIRPLWRVTTRRPDIQPFTQPTQDYLDSIQEHELMMYRTMRQAVPHTCKTGLSYLKVANVEEQRLRPRRKGRTSVRETTFDGIRQWFLRYDEVIVPPFARGTQPEETPWIAHDLRLHYHELVALAKDGKYDLSDITPLKTAVEHKVRPAEERTAQSMNLQLDFDTRLALQEWWMTWSLNDDSDYEELVVDFVPKTRAILSVYRNWNPGARRNIFRLPYMLREEGGYYPKGIGEMLYPAQEALSTAINQEIDNATLANTMVTKIRRGAVPPSKKIYPGVRFFLDDLEDVKLEPYGGGFQPQLLNVKATIRDLADRYVGVNDPTLGFGDPTLGSRTSTTIHLSQIREGIQRFDLNTRDFRDALGEVGRFVLDLNVLFRRPGHANDVLGEEKGSIVEALFLTDQHDRVDIEVSATSAAMNQDTDRQNFLMLIQFMMTYYKQVGEVIAVAVNPQIPPDAKMTMIGMAEDGGELVKRFLQTFDNVRDVDRFIPDLNLIIEGVKREQAVVAQGGAAGGPPGAPATAGVGAVPGMGAGAVGPGAGNGAGV